MATASLAPGRLVLLLDRPTLRITYASPALGALLGTVTGRPAAAVLGPQITHQAAAKAERRAHALLLDGGAVGRRDARLTAVLTAGRASHILVTVDSRATEPLRPAPWLAPAPL